MDLRSFSNSMPETLECRAAGPEWYLAAAALRQEMALEMGADFDAAAPDWRTTFAAYFGGKQSSGNAQLFLAYDGPAAIGCAVVTLDDNYRRSCFGTLGAYVNAVYVQPAYRRRGIAARLMNLAVAWAREKGCLRVRLRASDEGRRLYESLGFEPGREMELHL